MPSNTGSDIWIAGAVAAFTVDLLVYPLDTIKTRLQSPDYKRIYLNESTNTVKKGLLFRGLYQGVGSVIIATLPSSGAFFTTYEYSKTILTRLLTPTTSDQSGKPLLPLPIIHSTASAIAELVSCAILTPAEVIKQNSQVVQSSTSSSSSSSTKQLSATHQTLLKFRHKPLALWRGYGTLASRNLPHTAIQFPLYERFRSVVQKWQDKRAGRPEGRDRSEVSILENGLTTAAAAGSAGAIAAVVTTPVDVVKTRIMLAAATEDGFATQKGASKVGEVDAVGAVKDSNGAKRMSSWKIAKDIVDKQGWKGLMRGGALRGVWTMLGSGLYLGVYESGKSYLANRRGLDADDL